jgi:hypothetical protein
MLRIGQLECVYMALCVACCVESEKALINIDDHHKLKLHDKLCKLVVVTRPGRFWDILFSLIYPGRTYAFMHLFIKHQ